MLFHQNPRGKCVSGIPRQNRNPRLPKNGASIQFCGHLMHRATRLGIARINRALMCMKARVFGQKRIICLLC